MNNKRVKIIVLFIIFYISINILFYKNYVQKVITNNILSTKDATLSIQSLSVKYKNSNSVVLSQISVIKDQNEILTAREIILHIPLIKRIIFSAKPNHAVIKGLTSDILLLQQVNNIIKDSLNVGNISIVESDIKRNYENNKYLHIEEAKIKFTKKYIIIDGTIRGLKSKNKYNIYYKQEQNTQNETLNYNLKIKYTNGSLDIVKDNKSFAIQGKGQNISLIIQDFLNNKILLKEDEKDFIIDINIILDENTNIKIDTLNIDSDSLKTSYEIVSDTDLKINIHKLQIQELNNSNLPQYIYMAIEKIMQLNFIDTHTQNILLEINNINDTNQKIYLQMLLNNRKIKKIIARYSLFEDIKLEVNSSQSILNKKIYTVLDYSIQGKSSINFCNILNIKCNEKENVDITSRILNSDKITIVPFVRIIIGKTKIDIMGNIKKLYHNNIIIGKIKANNINLNKIFDISQIMEYIKFKSRNINTNINIQLNNIAIKNGVPIQKFYLDVENINNGLTLRNIDYQSNNNDIKGNIKVGFNYFNPEITIDLFSNKLEKQILENIFIKNITTANDEYRIIWSDKLFINENKKNDAIYPAIKLKYLINKIVDKTHLLFEKTNVHFDMKNSGNGMFKITSNIPIIDNTKIVEEIDKVDKKTDLQPTELTLKYNKTNRLKKGSLSFNGNASISDNQIMFSTSFLFNNIILSDLLKKTFKIYNTELGLCNIAGTISSKGINVYDIIRNMNGKITILSTSLTLNNFDMPQLVFDLPKIKSKNDLESILQVNIFKNSTYFKTIDSKHSISNGIVSSNGEIKTKYTAGNFASSLSLTNFNVNAISLVSFQTPTLQSDIMTTKIYIKGLLWKPKVYFDNDILYKFIMQNKINSNNNVLVQ